MELKYLTIRPGVHLTPSIQRTIECMDKFFDGEPTEVTDGYRTTHDQLTLIMKKLSIHGKDHEFVEFVNGVENHWPIDKTVHLTEIDRDLYWWQRAWSRLLNIGQIINPPMPAEVIFEYVNDGRNKKGEIIRISNHQHGLAVDFGGGKDLMAKAKCVLAALRSRECFIHNYRVERGNNCVHADCDQIGGGTG